MEDERGPIERETEETLEATFKNLPALAEAVRRGEGIELSDPNALRLVYRRVYALEIIVKRLAQELDRANGHQRPSVPEVDN